jgi:hypothetical protein
MKKISTLLVAIVVTQALLAQDTTSSKNTNKKVSLGGNMYKATVSNVTTDNHVTGYLAGITDSSILISPYPAYPLKRSKDESGLSNIDYAAINTIQLKRKGSVGTGIARGSLYGAVAGLLIGAISYQRPKDDFERVVAFLTGGRTGSAIGGGLLGGLTGGVVGGIIGAVAKKTFVIGGSKERFQALRSNLVL